LKLEVFFDHALILQAEHLKEVTLLESCLYHMGILNFGTHISTLQNLFLVSYTDWAFGAVLLLNRTNEEML
jgi:hypothetical protein